MGRYATTLGDLVTKLRELHSANSNAKTYVAVKNEVLDRLEKKILRLNKKLSMTCQIESWYLYLSKNEDNFYNLSQTEDFEILFRPDIDIVFHYKYKNDRIIKNAIFKKKNGEPIDCYRENLKIIIPSLNNGKIQSWSRLNYLSKNIYKKHWYEKNYKGKESKFLKDMKILELEKIVFQNGSGYFGRNSDEMFLYGKFDRPIGSVRVNGLGRETEYIKVQLNRVLRPLRKTTVNGKTKTRKDGYKTEIHGYPISFQELRDDFPVGADSVDTNVLQV